MYQKLVMERNRSPLKYQCVKIGTVKTTMSRKSETIGDSRLADLDKNQNCSFHGNDSSHLTSHSRHLSGTMIQYSENYVQYHCDHLRKVSSKRKNGKFEVHLQCQKSSINDQTTCSAKNGNVPTVFLIAITILSIVHGVSGQSIHDNALQNSGLMSSSNSQKSSDVASSVTGINLIWEPSSDAGNPSSITIIKIEPTSPPKIEITPTSSTSQQKEPLLTTTGFRVDENTSKETAASSSKSPSSSTVTSSEKTSEKKIKSPYSKSNGESEVITNEVTNDNNAEELMLV